MLIIINDPILYYKHKDGKYTFRLGFPAKNKNCFAKKILQKFREKSGNDAEKMKISRKNTVHLKNSFL